VPTFEAICLSRAHSAHSILFFDEQNTLQRTGARSLSGLKAHGLKRGKLHEPATLATLYSTPGRFKKILHVPPRSLQDPMLRPARLEDSLHGEHRAVDLILTIRKDYGFQVTVQAIALASNSKIWMIVDHSLFPEYTMILIVIQTIVSWPINNFISRFLKLLFGHKAICRI
jgi:hypothetical protein